MVQITAVIAVRAWHQCSTMFRLRSSTLLLLFVESVFSSTLLIPVATRGQVWPLPRYISSQQSFVHICPKKFNFKVSGLTTYFRTVINNNNLLVVLQWKFRTPSGFVNIHRFSIDNLCLMNWSSTLPVLR